VAAKKRSSGLAKQRLAEFEVLMEFANLGAAKGPPPRDFEEEWRRFECKHRWFTLPIKPFRGTTERDQIEFVWILIKNLRGVLSGSDQEGWWIRLWGRWSSLKFLLGLQSQEVTGRDGRALGCIAPADFAPVWDTGSFKYRPATEFQRVLHALWKQSWRARRCLRCARYFVAAKPAPPKYCSDDCRNLQRALVNAEYWAENKDKINAARRKGKK
jgi:hypothetical protein